MKLTFLISIYTLAMIFLISSCSPPESETMTSNSDNTEAKVMTGQSGVVDPDSKPNILQVALGSPDHTTLCAGVVAAGLQDVLTNAGPLTVFAPNNEAFDKLPEGTLDNLLKPENKQTLADIITFHAAPGSYNENNIKGVMGIGQATGDKVTVTERDGAVYVNDAKVLGSVKASNGYVHVIDAVLLPPEK